MDGSLVEQDAPRRAIEHLLQAARRHLDMEAAFLAELTTTEQIYRATAGETAGFAILAGGSLPRLESFCQRVMERGAPWVVPDTAVDADARALTITDTGRFGSYIGVPVRLSDGTTFGTLCCISHEPRPGLGDRDVAVLEALADVLAFQVEQLQAAGEDARRQELRLGLLSEIVRAAQTPAVVLDPTTRLIDYCNDAAARLLRGTPEAIVGTPLWEHTQRWSEAFLRERLTGVLGDGPPATSIEVAGVGPDDRVLDVVVQRITTATGRVAVLATAHDITERRRSEEHLADALAREHAAGEELRRLDAMRNAFLTAVSHELRTPLTTLRLAAETLREGRTGPELTSQVLERMVANADRLDRLLGDLLDLNQFTHGRLRLERRPVALHDLVREAVEQVELEQHEVELDLEPVEAVVAPTKVERIVVNLVLNASIHTRGGTITVRLARQDDQALLSVEDEGQGVAVPERERLFEPFRQGDTAPAHRPGTGIGLSLVAAFAELHGGRAWIDEAPGGGAAFRVLLPLGEQ